VIGTVLGMMGCSAPETAPVTVVTRDQYGANWPWPKFDLGIISCQRDAVLIKLGDVTYGLNGHSRRNGKHTDARELMERVPGSQDISADGRGLYRLGASDELIQLGLNLCSQQRR
jgi:hypothetical protein